MATLGFQGHKVIERGFFHDADLDFQVRGVLGHAARGASDLGEVLSTIARIEHQKDWAPQWSATATQTQLDAATARSEGHLISAASGFLRAATYWACAVDGLTTAEDSDELLKAFRTHRECWDAFVDCSAGAHVRVPVPYESAALPGYLLRPDASGTPRPTLIVTNGSDGAVSDLWGRGVAAALGRGWNAFVYDGPGQQSMLFEEGTHFRPDWEAVLTPVVDALVARPDVDAHRLLGYGVSQAGYWLPRALAFEHRLVAAVADPGVVDVSTSWTRHLSKGMLTELHEGKRKAFNQSMRLATELPGLRRTLTFRGRPYRYDDWFDLYTEVLKYRLDEQTAAAITTPMLIPDPAGEQFWPGQSAQLAELLTASGIQAELIAFTAERGANFHMEPLGRLAAENRIFDWLEPFVS